VEEREGITIGSGNVFADIGLENPEELLLKAQLGVEVANAINRRGLSDDEAVAMLDITQDELSALRHNPLHHSTGELLRLLNRLEQDVQVIVTPRRIAREQTAA